MASSIFFLGRVISVPGSYSEVDASGLEQIGLGASGIVAVIGDAEGGRPVSAIDNPADFIRINKPEKGNTTFRSGDLREAIPIIFAPAKDPDILAGAQEIVAMKTNPATQSLATLNNGQGPAIDLTSLDFGAFTSQINIDIQDGTNQGKLVTIIFEDQTESDDDVGGDDFFQLQYDDPVDGSGYDTATGKVLAGGSIVSDATRVSIGLDSEISSFLLADGALRVVSSNAADVNKVTVYGLAVGGAPQSEVITLTGTTPVDGQLVFAAGDSFGAIISGTTLGTVTVSDTVIPTTLMTITAGTNESAGVYATTTMFVSGGVITVTATGGAEDLIVEGKDPTGVKQLEKFTLAGATPVVGVAQWSEITRLIMGEIASGDTVTFAVEAVRSVGAVQNTILKAEDFYNARQVNGEGFKFTRITARTTFDPALLDVTIAPDVDIFGPANPGFKADINAIVEFINQNSVLMSAVAATGVTGGAPDNTPNPVFLVGGVEGTTTFADFQKALNLLKQTRVNTIVVMTGDPAVHAALDAHNAFMGGIGRSERDGVVGLLNTALTDVPNKTELKTQIVDLNTRHIRAVAQTIERFNTAGERQDFLPAFRACMVAGMQAGSPVGTSLTFKFENSLGFRQSNTWNPVDDAEELITAGLLFSESVEGVGRRVVRNITTHLSSNNLAFIEASVNESVNFATFNFRTNMEFAVGKAGFAGTVNAAKSVAEGTLGLLVDEETIVAHRSLDIELIVDVLEVSVELAPVIPINFVKNTIHLVTIRQTAA